MRRCLLKQLKIDVDIKPCKKWLKLWKQTRILLLESLGYKVEKIKTFKTRHGFHAYILLKNDLPPEEINMLQFLCGDDHARVQINMWRIQRGIPHWNKLFERTIYRRKPKTITCRYCGAKIPIRKEWIGGETVEKRRGNNKET